MRKWATEHFISPVPLIGPLFHDTKWASRFYMLGMSASMMFFGTYLMGVNVAQRSADDSAMMAYWKNFGNMFFAMAISGITYSVTMSVAKGCYSYFKEVNTEDESLVKSGGLPSPFVNRSCLG